MRYVQKLYGRLEDYTNIPTASNAGDHEPPNIEEIIKSDETLTAKESETNEERHSARETENENELSKNTPTDIVHSNEEEPTQCINPSESSIYLFKTQIFIKMVCIT